SLSSHSLPPPSPPLFPYTTLFRSLAPLGEWRLPELGALGARRWGLALLGAVLAGYLTAYLVLFPAPLLHGHQVVPRVLGLSLPRSEEHTSELQSRFDLVCRLLLEK